jgi:hypothetical protein
MTPEGMGKPCSRNKRSLDAVFQITYRGASLGARDRATKLREVLKAHVPGILDELGEQAFLGDIAVAKLVLDRTLPLLRPMRDLRPQEIHLRHVRQRRRTVRTVSR